MTELKLIGLTILLGGTAVVGSNEVMNQSEKIIADDSEQNSNS